MRFLLIILSLLVAPAWALEPIQTKQLLEDKYQKINAWQADFTQETFVEALDKTIQKKGSIIVKKPGLLKISYSEAPIKEYTSNGKKLWVYEPEEKQVQIYKKINKLVAGEALDFLNGFANVDNEFEVLEFDKSDSKKYLITDTKLNWLELVPRNTESSLNRLIIGINDEGSVKEITLDNVSGNKTHYLFTNLNTNPAVDDKDFEFVAPAGTKIINQ